MYSFYKILSRVSKPLSSVFLVVSIPLSILILVLLAVFIAIEPLLKSLDIWELLDDALSTSAAANTAFQYAQLGALICLVIIVLCWIIFFTAWILRKINFKRIAGVDIARNKEYRNHDINEYQERLEKYRYRD